MLIIILIAFLFYLSRKIEESDYSPKKTDVNPQFVCRFQIET